jgi:hypothetical protein
MLAPSLEERSTLQDERAITSELRRPRSLSVVISRIPNSTRPGRPQSK